MQTRIVLKDLAICAFSYKETARSYFLISMHPKETLATVGTITLTAFELLGGGQGHQNPSFLPDQRSALVITPTLEPSLTPTPTPEANPDVADGMYARVKDGEFHGLKGNLGEGRTVRIVTDFPQIDVSSMDPKKFMEDIGNIGFEPYFTGPIEIRLISYAPGEKPPSKVLVTSLVGTNKEFGWDYTLKYTEGDKTIYTVLVNKNHIAKYEKVAKELAATEKSKKAGYTVEFWTNIYMKQFFRFFILGELFANTSSLQSMSTKSSVEKEVTNRIGGDVTSVTVDYTPTGQPRAQSTDATK